MSFEKNFEDAVAAAFAGIWVTSFEHEDVTHTIQDVCKRRGWRMMLWDMINGLNLPDDDDTSAEASNPNAQAAVKTLLSLKGKYKDSPVILVMRNIHWQLGSHGRITNYALAQELQLAIESGSENSLFIVGLATTEKQLPTDLEKHFYILDHDLPGPEERWELFASVGEDSELPERDDSEGKAIIDNSAGLTRMECLGAAAMGLAKHKKITADPVWDMKVAAITKTGFMRVYKGRGGFDNVLGVDTLTKFMKRSLLSPNRSDIIQPRGVLLVGPPGSGKTMTAKECGNEIGVPTIRLDVGGMKGGLVGETEGNVRRALKTIDAMAPCILVVDEVEKALAGASSNNDSGVSAGIMDSLLDWMSDHETEVYVVMTSNKCESLPPELSRAGRLDALFFVDTPQDDEVRKKIWDMYIERYGVDPDQEIPKNDDWSPAEIEQCCKMARLQADEADGDLTLIEASNYVVPVALTYAKEIAETKSWAHRRCLAAHTPGIYDKSGKHKPMVGGKKRPRRKVHRASAPEENQ